MAAADHVLNAALCTSLAMPPSPSSPAGRLPPPYTSLWWYGSSYSSPIRNLGRGS
eukprot:CAMPEP_0114266090 /NCGR_PEP_ID=MMETSP0058-20121206/24386_1 /TAXON_ID=36894 /ORGANISM="Pyramimonas parkeae, CCMP726" /LENGTH=54 /DNA_ID=CAMNT_0001383471 /DNA_START=79 /DNA_END=240 /DNA_ORIENTATION=-